MKYFYGVLILIFLLSACSPSETLREETSPPPEPEPEPEEEVGAAPEWYEEQVFSSSDSLSFYGYSMASATDSSDAAELSAESALQNLRFEIDRHAEDTRVYLSEENGEDEYSETSFILQLRNAVREMDLEANELEHEYEQSDEGVYYVYTRAIFAREDLSNAFEPHISDSRYLEALRNRE
jgi:hypothetical protein